MLYAIGDLHLSLGLAKKKPMDIFGGLWAEHDKKIKKYWTETVGESDTVLIPGDVSWAMNNAEFAVDAAFIHALPGKKIIISGNHDYWWNSTAQLNALYPDLFFMKNTFFRYEENGRICHVCGSRGWVCPNDANFTQHDLKIYNREVLRLGLSLDSAMADGAEEIIVMMHYPPFNDKKESSDFVGTLKKYPVSTVVYGHLHGASTRQAVCEAREGIDYWLVSADFINFAPFRLVLSENGA
ncbi:MAG: metallophosphoesterase [Clostridiales bacterium]|jgi:predicted phosphohydrolase|nr:metallophosphoesterase [Clostridiales bacterium]